MPGPPVDPSDDHDGKPKVVELGYGGRPDNLIALADAYPQADVYGIEKDEGNATLLRYNLASLGSHAQVIENEYDLYTGLLRNQADIVVAVAPNPNAPIAEGIRNFIKPGGQVLVLTELRIHRDSLVALAGNRALVRQVPEQHKHGIVTVQTSLGVPLKSIFLDGLDQPWEIYIPTW